MRTLLPVTLVLLAACGGGASGPDGAAADLSIPAPARDLAMALPDLRQPVDLAGFSCGTQSCGPGTFCCVTQGPGVPQGSCAASCADGGVPVQCRTPADCSGNPCCLTLKNNNPESVLCGHGASDCDTMFSGSGSSASGTTRLCRNGADCTAGIPNTNFPDCCTTMRQGISQQFCFNAQLVGLTTGVTCP